MSVPSYLVHSFSLNLSNMGMDFPFLPLKLPNKGMRKYSKIILYIPLHSIAFHYRPSSQTRAKVQGVSGNFFPKFVIHLYISCVKISALYYYLLCTPVT